MKRNFVLLAAITFLFSCKNRDDSAETTRDTTELYRDTTRVATPDTAARPLVSMATATLTNTYPDTAVSGQARFTMDTASGKVTMKLEVTVPSKASKSVAVHIHEHGQCGSEGQMAHGHWNPTAAQHGKWGEGSFHSGDIGNLQLDSKGRGTLTLTTDLWSLGGRAGKNILGKSVIVHGSSDDYKTQPSGNAGTRIGCGVIQ
ncbi:MAG TPA: superoxide dismutase family protein [Chitinophagaceae bacterium]|nr:superoxide dismutase family protein [Chitinophagaceae bacterium]